VLPGNTADMTTVARIKQDLHACRLNQLVCEERVPLAEAQRAIARNWIAAYRKYAAGAL
jgi:hypothetical protein